MNGGRRVPRVFVLEVPRGYLRFDGGSVYARSGSAADPLRVEGQDAPEEWTKVSAPARILMGNATLVVRDEAQEEEGEWDADVETDDRTVPTGALLDPEPLLDVPPPAPPPPRTRSRAEQIADEVAVRWKQTPMQRKAILALLPIAFIAICTIFGSVSPAQQAPASPASSAAVPTSALATGAAAPDAGSPAEAAGAAPEERAAATDAGVRSDGGKTAARLAVDAVVAGDYATAFGRYERLAETNADKPAYAQAARILRAKADGGTP